MTKDFKQNLIMRLSAINKCEQLFLLLIATYFSSTWDRCSRAMTLKFCTYLTKVQSQLIQENIKYTECSLKPEESINIKRINKEKCAKLVEKLREIQTVF